MLVLTVTLGIVLIASGGPAVDERLEEDTINRSSERHLKAHDQGNVQQFHIQFALIIPRLPTPAVLPQSPAWTYPPKSYANVMLHPPRLNILVH